MHFDGAEGPASLHLAPEQGHHATMQEGGYSFTVDWWALGTLIFEALAGRPPPPSLATSGSRAPQLT